MAIDISTFDHVDDVDASACVEYLDAARGVSAIAEQKGWVTAALRLDAGDAVLDVGCGTGDDVMAMALGDATPRVAVGLDRSFTMTAESRARGRDAGGRCLWIAGDAATVPFADATFDACRCERLLMHVPCPAGVVDELVRVLRPGGRLALVEPDYETLIAETDEVGVGRRIKSHRIPAMARHPTIGRRLFRLAVAAGLREIEVRGWVVVATAYGDVQAAGARESASAAVAAGVVAEHEAAAWLASLERNAAAGSYFGSHTIYSVVGRR